MADYDKVSCYNIKSKYYGKETQIQAYAQPITIGKESPNKGKTKEEIKKDLSPEDRKKEDDRNAERSRRRTIQQIYDIARANQWEFFFTLTFRGTIEERADYKWCCSLLGKWLHSIKQHTSPDLQYIVVPELHKGENSQKTSDGNYAYHFHGLFSNLGNMALVDSGKCDRQGRVIYNVDSYKLGFSTATAVSENEAVVKYLLKYVTKDLTEFTKGKKRYWASKNCKRPVVITEDIGDYHDMFLFMQDIEADEKLQHQKTVEFKKCEWQRQAVTYYELKE